MHTLEVPRFPKGEPVTNVAGRAAIISCGTNLCITSNKPTIIVIRCGIEEGSSLNFSQRMFKDGVDYGSNVVLNPPQIPNDLGVYRIVADNYCGTDIATSVLSLCGEYMCNAPCHGSMHTHTYYLWDIFDNQSMIELKSVDRVDLHVLHTCLLYTTM